MTSFFNNMSNFLDRLEKTEAQKKTLVMPTGKMWWKMNSFNERCGRDERCCSEVI